MLSDDDNQLRLAKALAFTLQQELQLATPLKQGYKNKLVNLLYNLPPKRSELSYQTIEGKAAG